MLAREASLQELGFLAHAIRMRLHPEPLVTYVIDRNINYTDICISGCKFCAFYQAPGDRGTVLSREALAQKIRETRALGGTQVLLQGGLHPDLPFAFYEEMLRFMKGLDIHVHGFSPPEIQHFSNLSGRGRRRTCPGGGPARRPRRPGRRAGCTVRPYCYFCHILACYR